MTPSASNLDSDKINALGQLLVVMSNAQSSADAMVECCENARNILAKNAQIFAEMQVAVAQLIEHEQNKRENE